MHSFTRQTRFVSQVPAPTPVQLCPTVLRVLQVPLPSASQYSPLAQSRIQFCPFCGGLLEHVPPIHSKPLEHVPRSPSATSLEQDCPTARLAAAQRPLTQALPDAQGVAGRPQISPETGGFCRHSPATSHTSPDTQLPCPTPVQLCVDDARVAQVPTVPAPETLQ